MCTACGCCVPRPNVPTAQVGRRDREPPSWDLVFKRNSIERLKHQKAPLTIREDLPRLIEQGYEAVPEEEIVLLNWWGLTHDKPKVGTFMVRIKVPGGRITPAQFRAVGAIAERYGKNYCELTTRQGLQLHWVQLDQLPDVLQEIEAAGLTTVGGEGDTVRNITSCPLAGVHPGEAFDVSPIVTAAAGFFWGNPDYSNLPRKHKYTITACPAQCSAPEIHDVALIGLVVDGEPGFAVRVGGGLSSTPRLSRDLGIFVPIEEAMEVLRAVTDAWQHDLRYRVSRAKARIKFMIDDLGPEGFRALVEERLGRKLRDGAAPPPVGRPEHLGLQPQKQEGHLAAGFPVPAGQLTGTQMMRIADAVEAVGGDIRLTRQQNFIVGFVPIDKLEALLAALRPAGIVADWRSLHATSIACTSHRFCNYSVAETKEKLKELVAGLESRFGPEAAGLRIYVDGCPHACAHHWVGDIGLQGTTAPNPVGTGKVEAYDVTLRGGLGERAAIGKPLLRRVPSDRIMEVLVRLVGAWIDHRRATDHPELTFQEFCQLHTDEQLVSIALGEAPALAPEPTGAVTVRIPGPLTHLTDGMDYIEVRAADLKVLLLEIARRHPRLASALLREDGTVNESLYHLYVNGDDVRELGGPATRLRPGDEVHIIMAMAGG